MEAWPASAGSLGTGVRGLRSLCLFLPPQGRAGFVREGTLRCGCSTDRSCRSARPHEERPGSQWNEFVVPPLRVNKVVPLDFLLSLATTKRAELAEQQTLLRGGRLGPSTRIARDHLKRLLSMALVRGLTPTRVRVAVRLVFVALGQNVPLN